MSPKEVKLCVAVTKIHGKVFSATGESLPSRNKWLKAEDCTRQPPIELFSVVLNAACYRWKDLSYELRLSPGEFSAVRFCV